MCSQLPSGALVPLERNQNVGGRFRSLGQHRSAIYMRCIHAKTSAPSVNMKSARQLHAARSLSRLGEPSASRAPILGGSVALGSTPPTGLLRTTPTRQRLAQRHSASSSLQRSYATHTTPSSAESSSSIPIISAEDTYDIVIIGGANAGLALACALRKSSSPTEQNCLADFV